MVKFVLSLMLAGPAGALIFRDGPSPPANTGVSPTGDLKGSGWEHQVYYLNYHGTIISPKHVITARHLGGAEEILTRPVMFGADEEERYAIRGERTLIGETDFSIFEVWETFPSYADLYRGGDEKGREVVIHGSGVGRGAEITGKGWRWGTGETRRSRWGRNVIKGTLNSGTRDFLYFSFDDVLGRSEVMATGGDSGGGWFIREGGEWRLAAISSTVDSLYSESAEPANANGFRGAFYNASGLSFGDDADGWELIPSGGSSADPLEISFYRQSHTYGSRISSRLEEIEAVIAPALAWSDLDAPGKFENWLAQKGVREQTGVEDDPDGDGLTNLEEYLTESHPGDAREAWPGMSLEPSSGGRHRVTLRESLDLLGRGLRAVVEESRDLRHWEEAGDWEETKRERVNPSGILRRELQRVIAESGPVHYRLRISLESADR